LQREHLRSPQLPSLEPFSGDMRFTSSSTLSARSCGSQEQPNG
jgi:hypothetical protein